MFAQVRQVDSSPGSSPALTDSAYSSEHAGVPRMGRHSKGSTASEALEDTVTSRLRGEGSGQDGRKSASSVGSSLGEESDTSSLAILVSSDDRLEVTLSPGTMETILKLVEVSKYLSMCCYTFICVYVQSLNDDEREMETRLAECSYFSKKPVQVRNEVSEMSSQ